MTYDLSEAIAKSSFGEQGRGRRRGGCQIRWESLALLALDGSMWRMSLKTGKEFLNQRIVAGLLESMPSKDHPHISPTPPSTEVRDLVGSTLWPRNDEKEEVNHVKGFAWGQLALGWLSSLPSPCCLFLSFLI